MEDESGGPALLEELVDDVDDEGEKRTAVVFVWAIEQVANRLIDHGVGHFGEQVLRHAALAQAICGVSQQAWHEIIPISALDAPAPSVIEAFTHELASSLL